MNLRLLLRSAAVLAIATTTVRAEENRYDLIGRMLMPFVNVFARTTSNPNRAMSFNLRLEQMTDLPPELAGSHAEVALEYPDKLRVHGPFMGEDIVVCRKGQQIWAFPGSKVEALLAAAAEKKKLPKVDPKFQLRPFELPIPEKELVFLPALFEVKDVGAEPLDGDPCRVVDVYLMPQLMRRLKAQGWGARVWVDSDARPVRISLAKPGWMVALRFENLQFVPKLPENTWDPTAEQAADVLKLDAKRYMQLLGTLVK